MTDKQQQAWDSLVRTARWRIEQGKRNVIADLAPIIAAADEIERLDAKVATRQFMVDTLMKEGE